MEQEKTNSGLIIVVAIIAIIAVVLGWSAYNRSGTDLGTEAGQQIDQTTEDVQLAFARAEARAKVMALQARIEADASYATAGDELQAIESDLEMAYQNASTEANEDWSDVKTNFSQAIDSIQTGTANTLEVLAGLVLMLEDEVRPNTTGDSQNNS